MRRYVSQEKGYALLVVLLTIVITSLLIVPLISNALSGAVQVETTEEIVKAENLRDYSQRYYRQLLTEEITETIKALREIEGNGKSDREIFAPENFIPYLTSDIIELNIFPVENQRGRIDNLTFTASTPEEALPYLDIEAEYTGIHEGRAKSKTEILRLTFPGLAAETEELLSDIEKIKQFYERKDEAAIQYSEKKTYQEHFNYLDTVLYQQSLEMSGHAQSDIQGFYEKDLYIEEELDYSQNDKIYVKGNVYYGSDKQLKTFPGQGGNRESYLIVEGDLLVRELKVHNNSKVCVRRNVYYIDRNDQIENLLTAEMVNPLNPSIGESCDDPDTWEKGKINFMGETGQDTVVPGPQITPGSGWQISTVTE
ncbi:hypothetical protein [Alkalicoccus daliensis]|uniref:Uncharacterized protein n=1 Tax=Alkalicoccus daliensis TaxID=745820 RepID=A0A1H0IB47_9BACI|nr:hypothetical protein [Alkalicoccus daliensis]SDO28622.1 hypothetical protein SAMN04488053_11075 [Alkalicoccus daliensis]